MAHIFISHSTKDADVAKHICEMLESNGINCWMAPRNIIPGADWASSISKAINECAVFLLVFSENSAGSNQVPRELTIAGSKGIHILPYRIDSTEVSNNFEYYLSECHWIMANPAQGDYKDAELIEAARILTLDAAAKQDTPQVQNNIVINNTPTGTTVSTTTTTAEGTSTTNTTLSPTDKAGDRKKLFFLIGIAVAVIIIIGIVIALVAGGMDDDKQTGNNAVVDSSEEGKEESQVEESKEDVKEEKVDYVSMIEEYVEAEDYTNVYYYAKLAEGEGDPEGIRWLGMCYLNGYGVDKDADKAATLFQQAIDAGSDHAKATLAYCYMLGKGKEQDYEKAYSLAQQAIEADSYQGKYIMGLIYAYGYGVKEDDDKAVELLQEAADTGYRAAIYQLASMYYNGSGLEQDYFKAFEWYQKAAEAGHSGAMNQVGLCYAKGTGVEKDEEKAIEWYGRVRKPEMLLQCLIWHTDTMMVLA